MLAKKPESTAPPSSFAPGSYANVNAIAPEPEK